MGFSVCWIAVRGKTLDSVLADTDLKRTGKTDSEPYLLFAGAELPSGWTLVYSDRLDERLLDEGILSKVSRGAELITCMVEEHSMVTTGSCWRDGRLAWSVEHNGESGNLRHLVAHGELPKIFLDIRNRLFEELDRDPNSNCDYIFDLPAELSRELTGFRHDIDAPRISETPYQELEWSK